MSVHVIVIHQVAIIMADSGRPLLKFRYRITNLRVYIKLDNCIKCHNYKTMKESQTELSFSGDRVLV